MRGGAIEIETGSNRNAQIYENVKKSVEKFGFVRFVVADDVTYNAVLQQAAKYRFEIGKEFKLDIIIFNDKKCLSNSSEDVYYNRKSIYLFIFFNLKRLRR